MRLKVSLVGAVVLVLLSLPASALAGTYAWAQPTDFTKTGSGANPEHKYGKASWSYLSSGGALTFSGGSWSGGGASVGPSGSQLQMLPPQGGTVTLRWTSPFTSSTNVTVSGTIAQPALPCVSVSIKKSGSAISGGLPATISVGSGDTIDVVVQDGSGPLGLGHGTCDVVQVNLQFTASVPAPKPTLTTPADGATVGGQPTFSGTAATGFGADDHVTVNLYSGASAGGSPVQTLTAPVGSDGSYSVAPPSALADGQYTAVAAQDDLGGGHGVSAPNTFTVSTTAPAVTLDPPSAKPLLTATPTLQGKAATGNGASSTVSLLIYGGSSVSGTAVRQVSGTRSSSGAFAIQVKPALPDGEYTAVAVQQGLGGATGRSAPQTFSVKVHPPALTLLSPAAGSRTSDAQPVISGAAGDAFGDSPRVTVMLYDGSSTSARRLGVVTVSARGGQWSVRWSRALAPGIYTVRAKQSDDAGHTAFTKPHSFLVVGSTSAIGSSVQLSRENMVSVPITCTAPAAQTCTGTVEILTAKSFRPSPGGPSGPVRVMFACVSIPGEATQTVARAVPSDVGRMLRRAAPVKVNVTIQFDTSSGGSVSGSASRELQAAS